MTRKLAIAISGAVSLGSYEAGVMYEVLEAIAKHNEKPATEDSDRIEIDVITGASAGAMTAGVLAQKLLCDSDKVSLREPYNNPLYNSWVEDVDIGELLTRHSPNNYSSSLLSSDVVDDIANEYILKKPTVKPHPSAAKEVYVGIAMSNLNGWDYTVEPRNKDGDGEFTYTRYKDRFVCRLNSSNVNVGLTEISLSHSSNSTEQDTWDDMRPASWDILRECCLSSGAFPFAFAPRIIRREPGKGEFKGRVDAKYTYTDGGVFENEPLGLAKKLAEWIDSKDNSNRENRNEPNRFYLYIAPGNKKTTANNDVGRSPSAPADLWNTLQALVAAIFHQSRFQDWIIKDLDNTTPIFQITATDDELIGEVFSAFAGFLDIRFRFHDYNIGRESARAALIRFSKPAKVKPNPNLVHWDAPGHLLSANDWNRPIKQDDRGNPTDQTQNVNRAQFVRLARTNSLSALLNVVDEKKRKLIYDELIKRIDVLIDFFNEKLDEIDESKTNKFPWDGVGRRIGLKPILLPLAKIFLKSQLGLTFFNIFKGR